MNPMLEQIHSLPSLIRESFQSMDDAIRYALDPELCLSLKRLYVTGCGDSHHAAAGTELAFESLAGLTTEAMPAMQFSRYTAHTIPQSGPGTNAVIGISVSGEVSRTLEALQQAKRYGATPIALTASKGSRIFNAGEKVLFVETKVFLEPEGIYVPGVRSYLTSQLGLLLAAIRIGEVRGHLTTADANTVRKEITGLADAIEQTLEICSPEAEKLVSDWVDTEDFVFVGSGPNFATAMFSAAKVLEASGDAALAQETEEWAHLQYFAKVEKTPTFFITSGDADLSRTVEVTIAAKKIGRRVAAIAPRSVNAIAASVDRILPYADGVREMFSPLVACVPGELFATYRAEKIGASAFRNFEGGRSREGGGGISRIRTSELYGG